MDSAQLAGSDGGSGLPRPLDAHTIEPPSQFRSDSDCLYPRPQDVPSTEHLQNGQSPLFAVNVFDSTHSHAHFYARSQGSQVSAPRSHLDTHRLNYPTAFQLAPTSPRLGQSPLPSMLQYPAPSSPLLASPYSTETTHPFWRDSPTHSDHSPFSPHSRRHHSSVESSSSAACSKTSAGQGAGRLPSHLRPSVSPGESVEQRGHFTHKPHITDSGSGIPALPASLSEPSAASHPHGPRVVSPGDQVTLPGRSGEVVVLVGNPAEGHFRSLEEAEEEALKEAQLRELKGYEAGAKYQPALKATSVLTASGTVLADPNKRSWSEWRMTLFVFYWIIWIVFLIGVVILVAANARHE